MARVEAKVRGQQFWSERFSVIDTKVAEIRATPTLADFDAMASKLMGSAVQREKEQLAQLYAEHPELRPSAATTLAVTLRAEADRLEPIDLDNWLLVVREDQVQTMLACKSAIVSQHLAQANR